MKPPIRKNQFIWLTIALIGLMITGATARHFPDSQTVALLEYSGLLLLMMSLLSLKMERRWLKGFFTVIAVMILIVTLRGVTKYQQFEYFYLGLLAVFLLMAALLVGRQVLFTGSVDVNIIVGSIALYLIIGLIFGIVYTGLLEVWPDSLRGFEVGPWYNNISTLTYFSFVTLTTLGYGDISPTQPLTEVVVMLEAVIGMFYLAVIVASLIGAKRNG